MTAAPFVGHQWRKKQGEVVRVSLDQFKGRDIFDLRVWFEDQAGDLKPSKSGLTIAAWHLADIKKGVDAAFAEAVKRGLVDPEHLAGAVAARALDEVAK